MATAKLKTATVPQSQNGDRQPQTVTLKMPTATLMMATCRSSYREQDSDAEQEKADLALCQPVEQLVGETKQTQHHATASSDTAGASLLVERPQTKVRLRQQLERRGSGRQRRKPFPLVPELIHRLFRSQGSVL